MDIQANNNIMILSLLLLLIFEKQNIPDWQTLEHWFQLHSENFLINKSIYNNISKYFSIKLLCNSNTTEMTN